MAVSKKSLEGHEGADAFGSVSASDYTYRANYDGHWEDVEGYLLSYSISDYDNVYFADWEGPAGISMISIGDYGSVFVSKEDFNSGTFYGVFAFVNYAVKAAETAEVAQDGSGPMGDPEHAALCKVYIDDTHEDGGFGMISKRGYRKGDAFSLSVNMNAVLPDGSTMGDRYTIGKWVCGSVEVEGNNNPLERVAGPSTAYSNRRFSNGDRWTPFIKGKPCTLMVVVMPEAARNVCSVTPESKTYYYGTKARVKDDFTPSVTGGGWYFVGFYAASFPSMLPEYEVPADGLYMDGDKTVCALFTQKTVSVRLQTVGLNGGSGSFKINGEPGYNANVPYGSTCTIEAVPAAGSTFDRWEYYDGEEKSRQTATTANPFEFKVPNDRYNYTYQSLLDYPSFAEGVKEKYVDFWGVFDKGSGTGELLYGKDGGIVYGATGFPIYSGDKSPIILQTQAKGN